MCRSSKTVSEKSMSRDRRNSEWSCIGSSEYDHRKWLQRLVRTLRICYLIN